MTGYWRTEAPARLPGFKMAEYGEQDEHYDTGVKDADYSPFYDGDKARYIGPDLPYGEIVTVEQVRSRVLGQWEATIRTNKGRVTVDADYLELV